MKPSVIKLIGLYSLLYAGFSILVLLWAGLVAMRSGFSFPAVGRLMMLWEPRWWWLSVIGVILHVLAYLKALRRPRLMLGNLLCIWAFVAYVLVPNYSLYLVVLQLIGVFVIMTYHKPAPVPTED
ncbi:hypothetical protein [Lacticaseibacillus hegangensis]|uniref:Uncharacterized protein n=1 Tax=Lacticaseibacillus hegangensis TaxID=2486010 RepID=A0ABW4CTQ8_9LACO|nr:hypothetical protein [Lacticaseibacillus hegangensis]